MLSKDLVAASAKPLILSILAEGENYGYAIIQRVYELSDEQIEWKDGMLYPVLRRLEQQGLIQSEWRETPSGRKRRYYHLKQEGRMALVEEKKQWQIVHSALQNLWETMPCLS